MEMKDVYIVTLGDEDECEIRGVFREYSEARKLADNLGGDVTKWPIQEKAHIQPFAWEAFFNTDTQVISSSICSDRNQTKQDFAIYTGIDGVSYLMARGATSKEARKAVADLYKRWKLLGCPIPPTRGEHSLNEQLAKLGA